MILDASIEGPQSYVEDCEVCCNPIQVTYTATGEKVKKFSAEKANS